MTEPITTMEITITRLINPDGQLGLKVTTPEQFSFVEALGLLAAAQWQMFHQMTNRYGD
jgi:hypothetical protein